MKREMIKTRRLVIRSLKVSDYLAWQKSSQTRLPAMNIWDNGPTGYKSHTLKRFKQIVRKLKFLASQDMVYVYAVFHKDTGQLIGGIDFAIQFRQDRQMANFGYHIHNLFWGKGYGNEAAKAGLNIGFQQLSLNRLEAAIDPKNSRSIRLARSIRMRKEGIKRRYSFEGGKWVDQVVFVANPQDIGLKSKPPKI